EVIVTVDTCKGPRAYAGYVSSFHQVITSGFARLDDKAWKERVLQSPPAPPAWLAPLVPAPQEPLKGHGITHPIEDLLVRDDAHLRLRQRVIDELLDSLLALLGGGAGGGGVFARIDVGVGAEGEGGAVACQALVERVFHRRQPLGLG